MVHWVLKVINYTYAKKNNWMCKSRGSKTQPLDFGPTYHIFFLHMGMARIIHIQFSYGSSNGKMCSILINIAKKIFCCFRSTQDNFFLSIGHPALYYHVLFFLVFAGPMERVTRSSVTIYSWTSGLALHSPWLLHTLLEWLLNFTSWLMWCIFTFTFSELFIQND